MFTHGRTFVKHIFGVAGLLLVAVFGTSEGVLAGWLLVAFGASEGVLAGLLFVVFGASRGVLAWLLLAVSGSRGACGPQTRPLLSFGELASRPREGRQCFHAKP